MRQRLRLFQHGLGGLLLLVRGIAVSAEDALDDGAEVGADALAEGPVHGDVVADGLDGFAGDALEVSSPRMATALSLISRAAQKANSSTLKPRSWPRRSALRISVASLISAKMTRRPRWRSERHRGVEDLSRISGEQGCLPQRSPPTITIFRFRVGTCGSSCAELSAPRSSCIDRAMPR
jgi:hypothetical protein